MATKSLIKSTKPKKSLSNNANRIDKLYSKVLNHIDGAKKSVQRTIDTEMVKAYWQIGRDIIKEEQHGKIRAEYGTHIIKELSKRLNKQYGGDFGITTLKDIRQFYLVYHEYLPISHALRGQFKQQLNPNLGWIHYRTLMRIDRVEARQFYEIETNKNQPR